MDEARNVEVAAQTDPVVIEIVRNGVIAVTEEMKTNLMRTAYNLIIYEALDFTTGLFDTNGETVSIGLGLPMFIRGMAYTVKAKIEHFGLDDMQPGDILITNDAYITGSHLNHVTLTLPIFHDGVLVGFSCCMAHWMNIGGVLHEMTTDIYAEGLQIPILKLQRGGEINQDLIDMIMINVRIPDRARGDLRAQMIAVTTGERRFLELIDHYGREPVLSSIRAIMDQSERSARARTLSIPDGRYEADAFLDDDGITVGKRVPVHVEVAVAGDEMTVDLTGVAEQVRGFYNSGPSTGLACAQVAYKCLTSPTDYPVNDGSFRPLEVIVPPGRVVSAVRPAPMRYWMQFPMTIVDCVFRALAPAIPDRVIAGHHASLILAHVTGYLPEEKRLFIGSMGHAGGGWGAKAGEDGVGVTVAMNDGDTHANPIEMVEMKFPLLFERYALDADSGGAGRWRGGLGAEKSFRALSDVVVSTYIERTQCAPWGLEGGLDAAPNRVDLELGGRLHDDLPNAKVFAQTLKQGDMLITHGGGGGGFGSPLDRDAERVAHDVRQGYVSPAAAAELYGVVIDPETLDVDRAATERRRAGMRAAD